MKLLRFSLSVLAASITFMGCDRNKTQDIVSPDNQLQSAFELGTDGDGQALIVDLASVEKFSDAESFVVLQQPQTGKVTFDETVLIYTPQGINPQRAGKNQKNFIILESLRKNNRKSKDTIVFNPDKPRPGKDSIDCRQATLFTSLNLNYTQEDLQFSAPKAFGFLTDNTTTCFPDSIRGNLRFIVQPRFGTIEDKSGAANSAKFVVYTFTNYQSNAKVDFAVYRLNINGKRIFGVIQININEVEASNYVLDDSLYYSFRDSVNVVNVLKNDKINYKSFRLTASSVSDSIGKVFIKSNGDLFYDIYAYKTYGSLPKVDTIEYQVIPTGVDANKPTLTGKVYVFFKDHQQTPNYGYTLPDSLYYGPNNRIIDVVKNDVINFKDGYTVRAYSKRISGASLVTNANQKEGLFSLRYPDNETYDIDVINYFIIPNDPELGNYQLKGQLYVYFK